MNIFVLVDMEGISGIYSRAQVMMADPAYVEARRFMTWDVNACVEGCIAGGAKKVTVKDTHYKKCNLIWDDLDPRARYIQGSCRQQRMPGIESCDGLILLGYHAMAGTPAAILEHTISSSKWQNFWLNGKKSGELAIDAAIAGDYKVPTIMVSGDDKVCREARRFIKGVVTAEVKKGLAVEGGILLPKEKAHEVIRKSAANAVKRCKKIKPCRVKKPVTMRLELAERGTVPMGRKGVTVIDGRTYEVKGRTAEEAFAAIYGSMV